jgi:pimeloyl-ACP methyl ester carboxylesterase
MSVSPHYEEESAAALDAYERSVTPPHWGLMALEARAPWEFAAMLAASPWLKTLPRGDGHPVLVMPGLGANDLSTLPIRQFLSERGYKPYPWEQGLNLGPRKGVIEACEHRLQCIYEHHLRPVSLLGWSLGGVYAREIAKMQSQWVRSVITLGSPFAGHPKGTNAWRLYQWVSGHVPDSSPELLDRLREPPKDIPTTSVFSRSDGIVSWECCVNEPGLMAENIVLPGSHMGLGFNPLALAVVADRLAQIPGEWKPYEAQGWLARLVKKHP